jgi:hypothetical protein
VRCLLRAIGDCISIGMYIYLGGNCGQAMTYWKDYRLEERNALVSNDL